MKCNNIYVFCVLAALAGLSVSCVSGTEEVKGNAFAVAQKSADASVSYLNASNLGNFYAKDVEPEITPGNCYRFQFEAMPEDLANVANVEYITAKIHNITKLPLNSVGVTTADRQFLPYEGVLPVVSVIPVAVVERYLFINSRIDTLIQQNVRYQMFYNMDSVDTETGVYDLYLMAETDENAEPAEMQLFTAHNMQEFYDKAVAVKPDSVNVITCKLNYINRIEKEGEITNYSTATASNQIIFPVPEVGVVKQ